MSASTLQELVSPQGIVVATRVGAHPQVKSELKTKANTRSTFHVFHSRFQINYQIQAELQ